MNPNREIPSGLRCHDCGENLSSVVHNGWATLIHTSHRTDHPVRYRVTAQAWTQAGR